MENTTSLKKESIKMRIPFWSVLYTLLLLLTIVSCKKGDTGPAGPQGPLGATGVQGIQGPSGSQILSGSGAPAATLGANGDFYLDISSSRLYGPKTAASWGTPLNLIGATGATGATGVQGATGAAGVQGNTGAIGATGAAGAAGAIGATGATGAAGMPGSKIWSGTAVPDAALGAEGDYFLDKTTYWLYGPKTGGAWGVPVNLQGPMGPQGPTGATGATGATGNAGVIYSAWMTSPYESRDTTIDGTCYRVRHLDAPLLTTAILNTGTIITYFRVGSIGPYQMPYISDAGGATNSVNCFYKPGKIFVYRHTFNSCRFSSAVPEDFPGQPIMINLPQSLEYRYIIIPGGIAATAAKQGIDLKNYEVARQYFKILN